MKIYAKLIVGVTVTITTPTTMAFSSHSRESESFPYVHGSQNQTDWLKLTKPQHEGTQPHTYTGCQHFIRGDRLYSPILPANTQTYARQEDNWQQPSEHDPRQDPQPDDNNGHHDHHGHNDGGSDSQDGGHDGNSGGDDADRGGHHGHGDHQHGH